MNTKLHKQIMRRIYYAYAMRLATHTVTLHVAVLAILVYALAALVHVDKVLQNIASAQVGDLGAKLLQVAAQADALSLLVFGVLIFTVLSLPLRIPRLVRLQAA